MRLFNIPSLLAHRGGRLCLLGCLLVVAGCTSAPTHFFVLTPLQVGAFAEGGEGLALGIDPVRLPALLDRPHIVTRVDDHERRLAEFARWAEPLDENMNRVLAENLSVLLGSERIVRLPSVRFVAIDRRLVVDVLRFDGTPGAEAVLEVRWQLHDVAQDQLLLTRRETYASPMTGDGHAAVVAAMSEVLAQFSRGVAAALSR